MYRMTRTSLGESGYFAASSRRMPERSSGREAEMNLSMLNEGTSSKVREGVAGAAEVLEVVLMSLPVAITSGVDGVGGLQGPYGTSAALEGPLRRLGLAGAALEHVGAEVAEHVGPADEHAQE